MSRRRSISRERSCSSVASYLDFYTKIPDYSELHNLSDAEFYHRLQALKETQKNLSLDQKDGNGERPSSQSSFESRLLQEHLEPPIDPKCRNKSPPTIIVHSPLDNEWEKQRDGEISACQSPFETHSGLCRRMGSLSLDSSMLHIHGDPAPCMTRSHSRASKLEQKHEVPLLSRIPLFHKIMAQQEERRRVIHERNSRELKALVQPFSFTQKEEAEKQMRLMCSDGADGRRTRSRSDFKANPVPKNLFSDQVYDQMREDQFYRALRKKIRAQEMLESAKKPPSMEARDAIPKKDMSKSLDYLSGSSKSNSRNRSRKSQEDRKSAISATKSPFWNNSCTRRHHRAWRPDSNTESSNDISPNDSTLGAPRRRRPVRNYSGVSTARSNLASVLRTKVARNRLENKMKAEIAQQEELAQARFKERLLRLSPAWRTLDYSTNEDLALRLAQRRHEARQKGKKHRHLMDQIYSRVHHMPHLFQKPERATKLHGPSEDCRSKSLESCLNRTRENRKCDGYHKRKSPSFCCAKYAESKSESSKESSSISEYSVNNMVKQ